MPNRGVRAAVAVGVVLVVAALLVPLFLSDSSPLHQKSTPIAPPPPVGAATAVPLPPSGAYVGAWVKPEKQTELGRINAVKDFEQDAGRQLDVVHDYHTWDDFFPSEFDTYFARRPDTTLLLSWAGADTKDTADGKYDGLIRLRARDLKALKAPILLQYRWEMDRPNLQSVVHSGEDYIEAWKRIRSIFHEEGAENVDWVWCPTAEGFDDDRAQQFYPGDDQVDWLCADAYAVTPDEPLADGLKSFLGWARGHDKPIMIGEFGTQAGGAGQRARWLADVGRLVQRTPQIKAFLYFDSNVDRDGRKRDWSLQSHGEDVQAYGALLAQPYFNTRKLRVRGG
jgi:hypothetical protein